MNHIRVYGNKDFCWNPFWKKICYSSFNNQKINLWLKKTSANKNKPSTAKVDEYILCGCSMSMRWAFEDTGNKYDLNRGIDYMKRFCESLT